MKGRANYLCRRKLFALRDQPILSGLDEIDEYRQNFSNPYQAAKRGFVDLVIHPKDTRPTLITAFAMTATKREQRPRKKHGNIPL